MRCGGSWIHVLMSGNAHIDREIGSMLRNTQHRVGTYPPQLDFTRWHEPCKDVVCEATTRLAKEFLMKTFVKKIRGASMVEYALLLVAILLLAAGAFKLLGPMVGTSATNAGKQL
jgi:Flp pilus assembly pilin Flp